MTRHQDTHSTGDARGGRRGVGTRWRRRHTVSLALVAAAAITGGTMATGWAAPAPRPVHAAAAAGARTAAASTSPLPFDMPSTATLRASAHKVFAHYFTPYPISIDNKPADDDYYTNGYLDPDGESGKHLAYGGLLRDRPIPRDPLTGDYKLTDLETEVQRASAAGIDGFTVDILSLSGTNWSQLNLLIQAAQTVDPGFEIVLMPDMSSLTTVTPTTLAAAIAGLAASPSVYRLADGSLVVSPFDAEKQTPAWWSTFASTMQGTYGIKIAFLPCFLNFSANAQAYASISYGFANWGNRSPTEQGGIASNISLAHSLGKIWMQPVSVQDERPDQGIYDEADNTENLRDTWNDAISDGADWVQLTTWNDYSEGTQFSPSADNGYAYLDLSSYYLVRFKTGSWPTIVRDVLYLTSRTQFAADKPTSAGETEFMAPRSGTATPRDDVEVLSFLTAPASVTANTGPVTTTYSATAGIEAKLLPLQYGVNSASAARSGVTTASVSLPLPVLQSPSVQDLQYIAATSGRS